MDLKSRPLVTISKHTRQGMVPHFGDLVPDFIISSSRDSQCSLSICVLSYILQGPVHGGVM